MSLDRKLPRVYLHGLISVCSECQDLGTDLRSRGRGNRRRPLVSHGLDHRCCDLCDASRVRGDLHAVTNGEVMHGLAEWFLCTQPENEPPDFDHHEGATRVNLAVCGSTKLIPTPPPTKAYTCPRCKTIKID